MKRFNLPMTARIALPCLVVAAVVLFAFEDTTDQPGQRPGDYPPVQAPVPPTVIVTAPRQEIVDLPDDGGEFHLSLFLHDDWEARPEERYLVAMFEAEPRLKKIKGDSHYHVYTPKDPIYQQRFKRTVPAEVMPGVMIQDRKGKVYYKATGDNVITSPYAAGDRLEPIFETKVAAGRRPIYVLPWRRPKPCPGPCPTPSPSPPVGPDLDESSPVPDTDIAIVLERMRQEEAAREGGKAKEGEASPFTFWLVLLGAVGVTALATVVGEVRREGGSM